MEKVIKSSVSVPIELYVTRDADAQLATVITEMSRPGYISVARQMGKTSLLQHAKQQLQGENRTIIYFDLSAAVYESSSQYFQHIIDTILEVEEDKLSQAKHAIMQRRRESFTTVSASSEYDKELRLILRELPGTLVLILDEVDALAKATFSDEVFAQIRSVYFMRNTHNVLHNITYILSGVIEPAKLIKNKDNSPFNIATQIFLDDFTFEEHCVFVEKAKLAISHEVKARVYEWTSGNPRITYELCSALEDKLLTGNRIDTDTVNDIVQEMYLLQYNKAPVDHIRDVVLKNSLIRNAVKSVKKGDNISDESAGQLYLYGITASKFKSQVPKIKNKILEAALSDNWLREAEMQQKDLYTFGLEQLSVGEITEGIASINLYLENTNLDNFNRNKALFSIANAYHKLENYIQSNEYLDKYNVAREENPDDYYFAQFLRALNLNFLNYVTEGIELMQNIIDHGVKNQIYYSAIINQANFKLTNSFDKNYSTAIEALQSAIAQVTQSEWPDNYKNSIVSSANFRLALINMRLGSEAESRVYFERALPGAVSEMQPSILVGLILSSSVEEKILYANRLRKLITDKSLSLLPKIESDIDFTEKSLRQSLGVLYNFYQHDYYALIEECAIHYYNGAKPIYAILYEVGIEKIESLSSGVEGIFTLALKCSNITENYTAKCLQGIALCIDKNDETFAKRAIVALESMLGSPDYGLLNYRDLEFVIRGAVTYQAMNIFSTALRFISYLTERLDAEDESSLPGDCIAIYYLAGGIHAQTGNIAKQTTFYERALSLVPKWRVSKQKPPVLMDSETVDAVITDMNRAVITRKLQGAAVLANITKYDGDKIPRNTILTVRYKNGQIVTGKAKKLAADLNSGKCTVM
ncbi:AAA-like domain-containing protein [Hymenobacter sp. BT186]|uniref:AAA-like domain-containing protein n=1 Tax=Hymenobacter telluris TaxID=2816474 RepID=A0A939F139_9BACT|nr:AAA-like domain-containing protein [Hymenobacter telluris]MBO0360827.1 AAA-like domain-containing protein [Hymenobacter telluris]MBW3376856.1 AAA-like domain-containing protein [Hymenobacter norwichensis]